MFSTSYPIISISIAMNVTNHKQRQKITFLFNLRMISVAIVMCVSSCLVISTLRDALEPGAQALGFNLRSESVFGLPSTDHVGILPPWLYLVPRKRSCSLEWKAPGGSVLALLAATPGPVLPCRVLSPETRFRWVLIRPWLSLLTVFIIALLIVLVHWYLLQC